MSKEELIEEILDIIHSENSGLSTHQRVSEIEKILNQKKMSKEEYKICNSCGGKAKKTYDGWWCGWCHNEM